MWPLRSLEARQGEHPRSASAPLRCGSDTGGTAWEQLPGIVSLLLSLPSPAGNALRILKINSFSFPIISQQRFNFWEPLPIQEHEAPEMPPHHLLVPGFGIPGSWQSPPKHFGGKSPISPPFPDWSSPVNGPIPVSAVCNINPTLAL